MRINNNLMAMNTHRQYSINNSNVSKSVEKLSSGYRINRAGDDAAGLAISEKMRAQIRGLQMASKNSQDAISLVQTAEGALQESHNILQRMRELAVQSASDTNETTIDRGAIEQEFQQLIKELDDTANKTRFNDQNLIDGTFQATSRQLASAIGYATKGNTTYAAKTEAGTYTHTLEYSASTIAYVGGTAPTVTSNIGAASAITKLDITTSTTATDPANVATKAKLVGVTQGVDAAANQFELTFELETADSVITVTYMAEQAADGSLTVAAANIGQGATLDLTVAAGTSSADLAAAFEDLIGKGATITAAGTAASLVSTSETTAVYTPGTIANLTSEYNGAYTISLTGSTATDMTLELIDADGNKVEGVSAKLNLSSIVGAAASYTINLGAQFGSIALTSTVDATIDDVIASINGKQINVRGGVDPTVTGSAASAKITTSTGEEITLKAGDTSYTTKEGITVNFGRALTDSDFSTEDKMKDAIGGETATITVKEVEGKAMVIQTGANEGDNLAINIDKMDAWYLGVDLSSVADRESASKAITQVNDAINQVSTQRAALGALQNRLDHKIANLDTSAENLQSAESRIRDLDMASEMTKFTKNNILSQAATAMLAQANSLPQNVLQLLQ